MRSRGLLLVFGWAALAPGAQAHTRLKPTGVLKPRSESSSLKTAPCGGVASTDPTKRVEFTAGQEITVEWEESVNHPGHFRVAFSPDGATAFDTNVLKDQIVDDQDGSVNFNDPATYHQFSTKVTIPATNCDACAIQMIQVMTDRNPPSNYYSCADIRIVGGLPAPEPAPPAPAPPAPHAPPAPAPPAPPAPPTDSGSAVTPAAPPVGPEAGIPAAPTGLKLEIIKAGGQK